MDMRMAYGRPCVMVVSLCMAQAAYAQSSQPPATAAPTANAPSSSGESTERSTSASGVVATPQPSANGSMSNADVVALTNSHVDEDSIVSVIELSPENTFDISPAALVALKQAGVGNQVISAMIRATQERRKSASTAGNEPASASSAAPAPAPPPGVTTATAGQASSTSAASAPRAGMMGPGGVPNVSQLMSDPRISSAMAYVGAMNPGLMNSGMLGGPGAMAGSPHAYFGNDADPMELRAAYAQRAMTKFSTGSSGGGVSMLSSLASVARFAAAANPASMMAVSGGMSVARLFGGVTHSRPKVTYAWGLAGLHAQQTVNTMTPTFSLSYADIPGLDPDAYEPAVVRLVGTPDNYRLIGATREAMGMGMAGGEQSVDWIAEDRVTLRLKKQGRGAYSLSPERPLTAGEYALVLRRVDGYHAKSSGFGNAQHINAMVWDFRVVGAPDQQTTTRKK